MGVHIKWVFGSPSEAALKALRWGDRGTLVQRLRKLQGKFFHRRRIRQERYGSGAAARARTEVDLLSHGSFVGVVEKWYQEEMRRADARHPFPRLPADLAPTEPISVILSWSSEVKILACPPGTERGTAAIGNSPPPPRTRQKTARNREPTRGYFRREQDRRRYPNQPLCWEKDVGCIDAVAPSDPSRFRPVCSLPPLARASSRGLRWPPIDLFNGGACPPRQLRAREAQGPRPGAPRPSPTGYPRSRGFSCRGFFQPLQRRVRSTSAAAFRQYFCRNPMSYGHLVSILRNLGATFYVPWIFSGWFAWPCGWEGDRFSQRTRFLHSCERFISSKIILTSAFELNCWIWFALQALLYSCEIRQPSERILRADWYWQRHTLGDLQSLQWLSHIQWPQCEFFLWCCLSVLGGGFLLFWDEFIWKGVTLLFTVCLRASWQIQLESFDPVASSTSYFISCADQTCSSFLQSSDAICASSATQRNLCGYTFQYGDGSGTSGYYVSDTMHFETILANEQVFNSSAKIIFG